MLLRHFKCEMYKYCQTALRPLLAPESSVQSRGASELQALVWLVLRDTHLPALLSTPMGNFKALPLGSSCSGWGWWPCVTTVFFPLPYPEDGLPSPDLTSSYVFVCLKQRRNNWGQGR